MKWGWLAVATALMALLAVSCGGSKSAEPDKVVGVLLKCNRSPSIKSLPDALYYDGGAGEYSGAVCQRFLSTAKENGMDMDITVGRLNARYVVTVRTAAGSGYTVEVPATTTVRVGQDWPPTP